MTSNCCHSSASDHYQHLAKAAADELAAEIAWELREARAMVRAGNSETAITDRLDRALELLSRAR